MNRHRAGPEVEALLCEGAHRRDEALLPMQPLLNDARKRGALRKFESLLLRLIDRTTITQLHSLDNGRHSNPSRVLRPMARQDTSYCATERGAEHVDEGVDKSADSSQPLLFRKHYCVDGRLAGALELAEKGDKHSRLDPRNREVFRAKHICARSRSPPGPHSTLLAVRTTIVPSTGLRPSQPQMSE